MEWVGLHRECDKDVDQDIEKKLNKRQAPNSGNYNFQLDDIALCEPT